MSQKVKRLQKGAQLLLERNALRHVTLQKDSGLTDLQIRWYAPPSLWRDARPHILQIEQIFQVRESFVGPETSKVHLQERIDQLTRQLAVYECRPSVANGTAPAIEEDLPHEQQLE